MVQSTLWRPSGFLTGKPENPYAIVILNQPINKKALAAIIHSAALVVCADAGGDQYLNYCRNATPQPKLPNAVVGDLDSLTHETETYYRDQGVQISRDPDQYSTDFTKCLKWIRQNCGRYGLERGLLDVLAVGGLGGRVDQGFSQVHHLYMAQQSEQLLHGRIYLFSESSLTFILEEGENEVYIEPDTFAENVGIIPITGPTRITTQGLEWDVEDWLTEFGGQLSTSNHLRSDRIVLSVNGRKPLFTLELAAPFTLLNP